MVTWKSNNLPATVKHIDPYNLLVTLHAGWLHNCRQINSLWSNNLFATLQTGYYTTCLQHCRQIDWTTVTQLACNIADRLIEHLVCIENIFSKVILFFIFQKKPSKNFQPVKVKCSDTFRNNDMKLCLLWHTSCKLHESMLIYSVSANE